jgi:type II secretory ATPase GspE/PulE/Tfp pilus assembly ATPase PilB-like protein
MEPFLVASSLLAVLAIRLVRVLCPHCRRPVPVKPAGLDRVGVAEDDCDVDRIFEPVGCPKCRHTGFAGRTGIFEILRVTESIRELIQRRVTTGTMKAEAVAAGMKTLRQDGWRKVKAGITSLSEVLRVSHADELVGSGKQANKKKSRNHKIPLSVLPGSLIKRVEGGDLKRHA